MTRDLFADPQQDYREAVQFYQHDIDWTNRLILGDSLQVMASLAHREDLAGKVQMIYIDPPYGIKFGSNFQPEVGNRDVKDKEDNMIREPEMVRAYRDTWHLGVHSYLAYLYQRLLIAHDLLSESGSIFVQISDENLHSVRQIMNEVFGSINYLNIIPFSKTSGVTTAFLASNVDFLIWYAKDRYKADYYQLFSDKESVGGGAGTYSWLDSPSAPRRGMSAAEKRSEVKLPSDAKRYKPDNITSQGNPITKFSFQGKLYAQAWKTDKEGVGLKRLGMAGRLHVARNSLQYVRFLTDFPCIPVTQLWDDTQTGSFTEDKAYVVQTAAKVIERCLLMTTKPGDLILDPTCGSGTTAHVAEQWGRRWITIDTSRVAVAIARQRLLTAKFDFYEVKGRESDDRETASPEPLGTDPHPGFIYKTVPHITLKSIAQNTHLDPIFAQHEPILDARLADCNAALAGVSAETRAALQAKLAFKQKKEGKRAITDADRRRWLLPPANRDPKVTLTVNAQFPGWYHWEVPFDTDPDYPHALSEAITAYRAAWRAKMDAVNACIAANATSEELVDQPQIRRGVVRVSGPFTVEAVQPPEVSLADDSTTSPAGLFAGEPDALPDTFGDSTATTAQGEVATSNAAAYLDRMLHLLRLDGVRFPDNREQRFSRLESLAGQGNPLHAEGRWTPAGQTDPDPDGAATVGVVFGPQYGSVSAKMVEEVIRPAGRVYDDLVIAAFSFDGPAQAAIEEGHPRLRIHMAHIRPDVNPAMDGLLKEQPGAQLFSVFGQPRTRLDGPDDQGQYRVVMEGVDIYNPVTNEITPSRGDKVAAWFLDGDYDGRTFCITQAFFPDRTAWDKLARALKTLVDGERFAALSGTKSLPFPPGKHQHVAVKVIDPRGNEVMQVHGLLP
ncbi:site-specific DNA-methyltransferase [Thiorhodovibrio winogradskyi]|uniref:site-specific DNA-methyltransferase n=1 Tax=Thiorhodovibrio winogradskyi TaxID=77007 RepID=UPI002E2BF2E6|nr:site-specific DNA-methyltransferase [Thiorhodovibrio winogradskyi]